MKKGLFIILIIGIVTVASIIPVVANTHQTVVNVTVDPRIELLTIVQYLSEYPMLTNLYTEYITDIFDYFANFQDHKVISLYKEMSSPGKGFIWGAPPETMLYLSNPPELNVELPFTDFIIIRAGGRDKLEEFLAALRDFAKVSNFDTFFEKHREMYSAIIKEGNLKIKPDYIITLENYMGIKQHSYNIILAPLLHHGGYGPRVQNTEGSYDIFSIVGPKRITNDLLDFGDEEEIRSLIWHEFSHSFINPITEKYRDRISDVESNFDPIKPDLKTIGYQGDNEEIINEHIVRAINVRLTNHKFGKSVGNQILNHEDITGWKYIKVICKRLEEYEKQRRRYQNIEYFYPEIFKVFYSKVTQ